jgi:hypothetical protein
MKLKAITLQDFRQFYGTQSLDFSLDSEKNITLIHAENGVGKTNLQSSFLWALYGKTNRSFEQSNLIVNIEAQDEGKSEASVSVLFSRDDTDILVRRTLNMEEDRPIQRLEVSSIVGGRPQRELEPEKLIQSILSWDAAQHYFCDGEDIHRIYGNGGLAIKAVHNVINGDISSKEIDEIQNRADGIISELQSRYRIRLSEEEGLFLVDNNGRQYPAAAGETLLAGIAFYSALFSLAHESSAAKQSTCAPAPVFLDSLFGMLDLYYRERLSVFLPSIAPQVILTGSSSQHTEQVLEILNPHVGSEYILFLELKRGKGEWPGDCLTLHGQEYQTASYDRPRDLTKIQKVL